MDKRDIALQTSCPTIIVPRFSEFTSSEKCGDRVLVASNGIFIEITRKWGYFIRKISDVIVTLPYGAIQEKTKLFTPKLPRDLLKTFNALARENHVVEIGASIVWNSQSNAFRLLRSESLIADSGFLRYKLADISDNDHLIIDCHSHSDGPAFFSKADNEDDCHMVKFSYVAGNCNQARQSTVMRLCLNGMFEPIDMLVFFGLH